MISHASLSTDTIMFVTIFLISAFLLNRTVPRAEPCWFACCEIPSAEHSAWHVANNYLLSGIKFNWSHVVDSKSRFILPDESISWKTSCFQIAVKTHQFWIHTFRSCSVLFQGLFYAVFYPFWQVQKITLNHALHSSRKAFVQLLHLYIRKWP